MSRTAPNVETERGQDTCGHYQDLDTIEQQNEAVYPKMLFNYNIRLHETQN